MKIKEEMIAEPFRVKHESYCTDCYESLAWESHNNGDIDFQYWIAFCKCNDGQRMWKMNIEIVKFTSINGD
jgi:hypothetical protein